MLYHTIGVVGLTTVVIHHKLFGQLEQEEEDLEWLRSTVQEWLLRITFLDLPWSTLILEWLLSTLLAFLALVCFTLADSFWTRHVRYVKSQQRGDYHVFDDEHAPQLEPKLWANNSRVTAVTLRGPGLAHRLGEALEGNQQIKRLNVVLSYIRPDEDLTPLLRFIRESQTLKEFILQDDGNPAITVAERRRLGALFLASIHGRQTNLKKCQLRRILTTITSLKKLLSSPIDFLSICCNIHWDFTNVTAEVFVGQVMAAFRMTSMPEIELQCTPTNIDFVSTAIGGLAQNSTGRLKNLWVAAHRLDRDMDMILNSLCAEMPSSLTHSDDSDYLGTCRRPKFLLSFYRCNFNDVSFHALKDLIRAQPEMALELSGYIWNENMEFPRNINIFQSLVVEGGCKHLLIDARLRINGQCAVPSLCESLQQRNCSLSSLAFWTLDKERLDCVLDALPNAVSLRNLQVSATPRDRYDLPLPYVTRLPYVTSHLRRKLLKAVCINRSLWGSDISQLPGLTQWHKRAIHVCLSRNIHLLPLIESTTIAGNNDHHSVQLPELLAHGTQTDIFVALQQAHAQEGVTGRMGPPTGTA